ncbi:MAG: hypothetical protein Kow0080_09340 [Candidatus Promineifilaceae bacterium]
MAPMLKRLVDAYPNEVQVIYRHFPLNQIHALAQMAAEASEAAGAQGMFWEYHDELFARQSDWSRLPEADGRDYFVNLAKELGLDDAKFAAELDNHVYADYVSSLEQEAMNLGLPGTPSIIFQGQLLSSEETPRIDFVWDAYVQLELLKERQYDAPPEMTIDENATYRATVEMENGKSFVIELYPKSAPQTVNSFIFLAEEGWFDGVTFHRVLPGFVAQTGDPTGTGVGGPGYTLPLEIDPELSHAEAGMVAMARSSDPNSAGSQWYITLGDASMLDGQYTIFGKVMEGMDVVQAITPRDPSVDPTVPPGDKIVTITIEKLN